MWALLCLMHSNPGYFHLGTHFQFLCGVLIQPAKHDRGWLYGTVAVAANHCKGMKEIQVVARILRGKLRERTHGSFLTPPHCTCAGQKFWPFNRLANQSRRWCCTKLLKLMTKEIVARNLNALCWVDFTLRQIVLNCQFKHSLSLYVLI